ncbi:MAG TPA: zinc ribbon domain-containing protein [Gemmatimonadales bacterium]|nr:zinc ribbon domain-containing protein [Gemmatimonadales bacterium]
MIWVEALAALLVGVALTALVVSPLVSSRPVVAEVDDEPEEFDQTPKGIALAALKEIEFDRATGKLSEDDYQFLKARYSQQALAAIKADDGAVPAEAGAVALAGAADDVESLIAARARAIRTAASSGAPTCPTCGPRPEPDALFCSDCSARLVAGTCGQCSAPMEAGSRFCDRCGSRAAA